MKQVLEAFKFSNISVDEYGSGCQQMFFCLYVAICYKHLHLQFKLYLCGIHFAYLRTGVQCPFIEHDNFGLRIILLLNVLNVHRFK